MFDLGLGWEVVLVGAVGEGSCEDNGCCAEWVADVVEGVGVVVLTFGTVRANGMSRERGNRWGWDAAFGGTEGYVGDALAICKCSELRWRDSRRH